MTISFTDDSLSANYAAGSGGSPATGKTQGTCICMSTGSVRVNIGTTDTGDHTTLIEGYANGAGSYYDVSYVEGFTHPVVCRVNDGSSMSGHHEDLFEKGDCDHTTTKDGTKVCINPGYTTMTKQGSDPNSCWRCTLPSQFFAPASGAAYTYPFDDAPCASGPMSGGGQYRSPMGKGQGLTCCVGPNCSPNTFSTGGQTAMGNCNRPDCMPCQDSGSAVCTSACQASNKRDLEDVLQMAEPAQKHHRRHSHHHAHAHGHAKIWVTDVLWYNGHINIMEIIHSLLGNRFGGRILELE